MAVVVFLAFRLLELKQKDVKAVITIWELNKKSKTDNKVMTYFALHNQMSKAYIVYRENVVTVNPLANMI